jgi:hypothetical protein
MPKRWLAVSLTADSDLTILRKSGINLVAQADELNQLIANGGGSLGAKQWD